MIQRSLLIFSFWCIRILEKNWLVNKIIIYNLYIPSCRKDRNVFVGTFVQIPKTRKTFEVYWLINLSRRIYCTRWIILPIARSEHTIWREWNYFFFFFFNKFGSRQISRILQIILTIIEMTPLFITAYFFKQCIYIYRKWRLFAT